MINKFVSLSVAAVAVSAAVVWAPQAQASGQDETTVTATQYFRNDATGYCLDDSEQGTRTFPCNGLDYQYWAVGVQSDGTRTLKNIFTGKCLTSGQSGSVGTQSCDSLSRAQRWNVYKYSDGSVEFKNALWGLCLDDSADYHLRTFSCGTHTQHSPFQTWR
ncbi:ricin-type beta-trefoil lectin domain protein [Streptomyces sp. NBS 14/10]|uniref:RICIN domain-containing protein n=1 Tax=Streptomyces sp. NBS 14/10 TaxID=1945643 RepID=UPI0015C61A1E|nr:ricin-type beta-trefoil lectin domain protein [Streptomyces sp. NBS 14/10]KAK1177002.1 ricin-type beta-trefoil lectin domain protein [Streptomyces sp. NBS 14/10]